MQFIQGSSRNQTCFATMEDHVAADNPVRLMDAFVDKLDLQKLGFSNKLKAKNYSSPRHIANAMLVAVFNKVLVLEIYNR
ncbi:hypothetical protein FRZ67_17215 [Panacibacter ginsenosidivorans]|uniref:Transposase n=1 Tax=Panacibacter ginsenosidivorans TaxID=1813871 RepID=A0A5B8VD93_9BACT|nr:hypothetical protein [Panacibacter ginsenosidivorans]QEC68963.1 hypothetical protein FRZ67_17215 [Panacibacter ginsenosidivorans]